MKTSKTTDHQATPSKGFVVSFEGAAEGVVLSDNLPRFYVCTPFVQQQDTFSLAWTGEKNFLGQPGELRKVFNGFQCYKVMWKVKRLDTDDIDSLRFFLRIAYPDIASKLDILDQELREVTKKYEDGCRKLAEVCDQERRLVEHCWKKKISAFLMKDFFLEENSTPPLLTATGEIACHLEEAANKLFLTFQEEILSDFRRLREKTLIIRKVSAGTSKIFERKALEKFTILS